ncbi:MAG: TolC family protein [Kiritimatiellae bacterium]|nr:TolC family protein [Kiritimatiellia bacterium]
MDRMIRGRIIGMLVVVLAFACANVYADKVKVYRLEDCIRISMKRNAGVESARLDESIAETRTMMARSGVLPHVSFSAGYSRLDELQTIELGDEEIEIGTLDNYSANIGITQALYSGGKSRSALKAARFARSHAEQTRAESESKTVYDVKIAFYNLIMAGDSLKIREQSWTHLKTLVDQARKKFGNGVVSEFDLLAAEVQFANEKPLLIKARNSRVVALERLRRLLNVDDQFVIDGSLVLEPVETNIVELQRNALKQRSLIHALEAGVHLAEESVNIARADRWPKLSALFNYNGANSYEFVSYEEDEWEWHWGVGLVLKWNIWDSGLTKAVVRKNLLETEKSKTTLQDTIRAVKLDVKECCLSIIHARESAMAGTKSVQLAERAMKIAQTRYREGLATHVEFSDANLALGTAQLMRLRAIRDHMAAVACLKFVCGAGKAESRGIKEF